MALNKKSLLKIIILFFICVSALAAMLLIANIVDPRIEFKDRGLEIAVRNALDNKYRPITKNALLSITELDASNKEITALDGIEYLYNLVSLNLEGNGIEDLNPLYNLKNLQELNLRNNSITDLEKINFNAISDLPLIVLNLEANALKLGNDERIRLSDIGLLSQFSQLKELYLRENDIEDISPLESLGNLEILDLRDNRITDIDALGSIVTLKELNLRENNISDIGPLSGLKNLVYLNIRSNRNIESIEPIKDLTNLKELNLRGNDIRDTVALSGLKNLVYLNIHSNSKIESIKPIASLTGLQTLIMRNIDIGKEAEMLSSLVNLKRLNVGNCSISDISFLAGYNKLEELDLIKNDITDINALGKIITLKELNLRENKLSDIGPLSGLKNLVYLNIHSNSKIESIKPIASLTGLQTLIMRNIDIGKEAEMLSSLVNLKRLNVGNCSISDISFLANLMNSGALQDDPLTGEKAGIDIRDNPIFTLNKGSFESIRPYWKNISIRAPFVLPMAESTLDPPVFSQPGGFYKEGFLLELNISDPNSKIFYTLDGSEPTISSNLYTGPIKIGSRKNEPNLYSNIPTSTSSIKPVGEVFKATVIRARTFKDDSNTSRIVTHTYFIDEKNEGPLKRYSLPLISITTDADNLFNEEYGILVPGINFNNEQGRTSGNYFQRGLEWERPVHIEFFEPDGTFGFSQNAGLKVDGGSTRYLRNKSMSIHASYLYDKKDIFDYPIFPGLLKPNSGEPVKHFKSFMLRNSGNDYNQTFFRDGILQTIVSHLGFDTQAYRPCIVFINGEYWGIYNIRERYDDWYIQNHYGVDISQTVVLDNYYAAIKIGGPEDKIHFSKMVQFVKENADSGTINDPGIYEYINTLMDIDNFIKYFASEIFFRNYDWPDNNISFWRKTTETYEPDSQYGHDGRWRWMMFDLDASFGLWDQSIEHNTLKRRAERNELFAELLKNNKFKYQFINTMADLINSIFKPEWTIQNIENARLVLAPEMPEHLRRWNYADTSIEQWNESIDVMIEFAKERPSFQIQHINEYFSLNGTTEINLITDSQKGYIKINSLELKEGTPGIVKPANWKGIYFKEIPIHITAIPYPGYEFLGWAEIENNEPSITITLEEELTLTAVFIDLPN